MDILWLDSEIYSTVPITAGGFRYAEGAEPLLVSYALNDEPAQVWEYSPTCCVLPKADRVIAHNAQFDRLFFPYIPAHLWRCTMAQALAHSLPGALADLCTILKVPTDHAKDEDGKRLIGLFCIPQRDGSRFTKITHPPDWALFKEYARLDVEAMREVARRLPKWNYNVFA